MRTINVNFRGNTRLACFSSGVVVALEEKYGDVYKGLQQVLSGKTADAMWFLTQVMNAGSDYAEYNGMEVPPRVTEKEVLSCIGIDDFKQIFADLSSVVSEGSKTTVEVEPEKNVEARQEES